MDLLLKHFKDIVQSEADVREIKKAILRLAMKGRLERQHQSASSVDNLIRKIKKEKKEKGIREDRNIEEIKDVPYELPNHWEWIRLGEFTDVIMGQSPPSSTYNEHNEGLPFYQGKKEFGELFPTPEKWCTDPRRIAEENDILISVRAPVGPTNICIEKSCIGRGLAAIRALSDTNHKFLLYFLRSIEEDLSNSGVGSTFKAINKADLINVLVPVPPLNEQNIIVETIEKLFRYCDQLLKEIRSKNNISTKLNTAIFNRIQDSSNPKQKDDLAFAIQNMDSLCNNQYDVNLLKESLLSLALQGKLVRQDSNDEPASALIKKIEKEREELIQAKQIRRQRNLPEITDEEKPYVLPEGWEWVRLGHISNYGQTDKANKEKLTGEEWILELGDIEKDSSRILQRVLVKDRSFKSSKNEFKKDDVLFGKLRPYLNKVVVADMAGICSTEIVPIRLYSEIDSFFIKYALKSPYFMNYVDSLMAGVKMPRLRTEDGRMALIPLPPLHEQKRIVDRLNKLLGICNQLEQRLEKREQFAEKLRNAVLSETSIHNYETIVS